MGTAEAVLMLYLLCAFALIPFAGGIAWFVVADIFC